jgi:hypothetical protein
MPTKIGAEQKARLSSLFHCVPARKMNPQQVCSCSSAEKVSAETSQRAEGQEER